MRENEFIAIVNRNNQRLYLISLSYTKNSTDTEDIMQNVFMKLRDLYDKRNTDFSVFLYFMIVLSSYTSSMMHISAASPRRGPVLIIRQ